MAEFIAVRVFFNRYDAEQAKGLLDEANVKSFISADDCGGFRPHLSLGMGNVRLLIHPDDLPRANTILKVLDDPDPSLFPEKVLTDIEKQSFTKSPSYQKTKITQYLGILVMGIPLLAVVYFFNKSEVSREFYPNRNIKQESVWRHGKLNGAAKEYYQSGQVKAVWPYKNNELNGRFSEYYPDGVVKLTQEYKNNESEGESKTFYENGSLESVGEMNAGKNDGRFTSYYKDGSVWEPLIYNEGKLLDKQGNPFTGTHKTYYQSGALEGLYEFKDGELDGETQNFHENGRLEYVGTFKENIPQGTLKEFYANGNLRSESVISNGETVQLKEFDEQGNVIFEQ